jgi:protein TonB
MVGSGGSFILHVSVILLFLVFIDNSSISNISSSPVTVFLDNQEFAIGSGSSGDKREAEKPIARKNPVKKMGDTASMSAKILHDNTNMQKPAETTEVRSNSFSDVIYDSELSTGDSSKSDENVSTEAGNGVGPLTGSSGTVGRGSGTASAGTGTGKSLVDAGETAKKLYFKTHFAFIRELILDNLTYPVIARRMGWKGNLTVSFVICEGGNVENVRIVKSSGHKILDDNALSTIRGIQPFPKPPVRAEIVIPIEYRIG